ncbi:MAG TPA: DNA/RNA nuclease SfsA [Burkholderiales bacterium]|nr:DNA/RNA nuclease SfsA [Burkholderiales bacterium]
MSLSCHPISFLTHPNMIFTFPLVEACLVRRYKRFLADVTFADGSSATASCPNTGSMMGVAEPGSRVWLTHAPSPTRKYDYAWELTETSAGVLVGINTSRPNALVAEAIEAGVVGELAGYISVRREFKYGVEGSRIDLLLEGNGAPCYVEVKNVTAAVTAGVALFPDAVSDRGSKHLRELMAMVAQGNRAVLVFCVQRGDVKAVRPADEIDPVYGRTLREAIAAGVEVLAYRADVGLSSIALVTSVPVVCS